MRWLGPAGAALLIVYPFILTGPFYERMGADLLLAAIAASAWNIVGGYAGQISVGHAMFFGAGAYAPLLVYTRWQLPPLAGVPLGIASRRRNWCASWSAIGTSSGPRSA